MACSFDHTAAELVEIGRWFASRGWAPAGAGNYSARLDDGTVAITVSGAHKGRLGASDIMRVDLDGGALDGKTPSAETLLHLQVYRVRPRTNAVLHTHSVPAVSLLRRLPGHSLRLAGYELLKAYPGVETHTARVDLPIVDNDQDMAALAAVLETTLGSLACPAYLIRDHGLYGWGATVDEASRVIEATEHLLECELAILGSAA